MTLLPFPPQGCRIPPLQTDRRANAPVIFHDKSHALSLWAIASLHRGERDFFGVALDALETGRTELFKQALAGVRVHAQRVAWMVAEMERGLDESNFEDSANVYGTP